MSYLVFQREVCPETRRSHWQGYCHFKRSQRLASARRLLGSNVHCEKRQGTVAQAREYCMKEESRAPDEHPQEFGDIGVCGQGTRSDVTSLIAAVKEGKSDADIVDDDDLCVSWFLHYRKVAALRATVTPERDHLTRGICLWGPTGTGKSTWCRRFDGAYWKDSSKWWDGYTGQSVVILDDFYGDRSEISYDEVLRLINPTPLRVQVKGGYAQFQASLVVFTSNEHPRQWYPLQQYGTLKRRLDCVIEFKEEAAGGIVLPPGTSAPALAQMPALPAGAFVEEKGIPYYDFCKQLGATVVDYDVVGDAPTVVTDFLSDYEEDEDEGPFVADIAHPGVDVFDLSS